MSQIIKSQIIKKLTIKSQTIILQGQLQKWWDPLSWLDMFKMYYSQNYHLPFDIWPYFVVKKIITNKHILKFIKLKPVIYQVSFIYEIFTLSFIGVPCVNSQNGGSKIYKMSMSIGMMSTWQNNRRGRWDAYESPPASSFYHHSDHCIYFFANSFLLIL